MGNMQAVLAVAATMAVASIAGIQLPFWVPVLVFLAASILPRLLSLGGVSKGSPAAPLDNSVVMLQGDRPTPGAPGKVVVVERWATWCGPCVATIPHLNSLYDKYSGRDDVQMVAVTNESDSAKIQAFMAKHGMKYPVALDTKGVVDKGYPSAGIPNATIIGKNGLVYWNGHPAGMDAALEQAVNGAVAEPAAPSQPSSAGAETKRSE